MARGTDTDSRMRYLDGEAERRALIADIHTVRRQVIAFAQGVPQEAWYEPHYHGWSLAAVLAHLHLMDNLTLMQIKLALIGIGIGFTAGQIDRFNDASARWFQRRLVTTTLRGIEKNERRIADFIVRLPIDRFTRTVYFPPTGERLTVERAVQQYFLFHWQHHLATLTEPPSGDDRDDYFYEPPPSGVGLV